MSHVALSAFRAHCCQPGLADRGWQTCIDSVVYSCLTILNITTGTTKWCEEHNPYILQPRDNTDSYIKGWRGRAAKKHRLVCIYLYVLQKQYAYQPNWRSHRKFIWISDPHKELSVLRHAGTFCHISFVLGAFESLTWFVTDDPCNAAGQAALALINPDGANMLGISVWLFSLLKMDESWHH